MGRFGKSVLVSALALSLVCMLASSNVAMGQELAPPPAEDFPPSPSPVRRPSPPSPVARSSPPSPVARSSPPSPVRSPSPPSIRSPPSPPTNRTSPPSPAADIISLKYAEAYSSSVAPCTKRYCLRRGLNHLCKNAIDGDLQTHFKSLPYKKDYDQWLGIKLDGDYYITSIEFYTYAGHLVSKMENLEVRAGLTKVLDVSESHKLKENELVGEQKGVFQNGREYQVVLDKPVKACYVSFQNKPDYSNSESALAITEVVIHGYKNRKSSPPPPKRRSSGGHPKGYKN